MYHGVYNYCFSVLSAVIAEMPSILNSQEQTELVYTFLTSDTIYDRYFGNVPKNIIQQYKKVIMGLIAGNCFILDYRNVNKGLVEMENTKLHLFDDKINYRDIVNMFLDPSQSEDAKYMINVIVDSVETHYIAFNEGIKMIIENGMCNTLLRVNPFLITGDVDYEAFGTLTEEEAIVQNCLDAFIIAEDAIEDTINDEEAEVDDATFVEIFLSTLTGYCKNDQSEVRRAIAYMLTSLYEYFSIHDIQVEELGFEKNHNLDILVERCFNDDEYLYLVADNFNAYNWYISEGSLEERHELYDAQCKEDKTLEKLK